MEKKKKGSTRVVSKRKNVLSCCLMPKIRQWSLPSERNQLIQELRELNVLALAVDQHLATLLRLFKLESIGLALIMQGLTLLSLEHHRETVRMQIICSNVLRVSIGAWILSLVNSLSS